MTDLAVHSLALGGLAALAGLAMAAAPQQARRAILAFPRHRLSAWVLTAGALVWTGFALHAMPMGGLSHLKRYIWPIAPVAFILLAYYLPELLAPRALGGLLLLWPTPMLDAARWHPSPWRYAITLSAYVMVVAGMMLVMTPYRLRLWSARWIETDARLRAAGYGKLAYGLVMLALGLLAY